MQDEQERRQREARRTGREHRAEKRRQRSKTEPISDFISTSQIHKAGFAQPMSTTVTTTQRWLLDKFSRSRAVQPVPTRADDEQIAWEHL